MEPTTNRARCVFQFLIVFVAAACSAEKSSNTVIDVDAGSADADVESIGGNGGQTKPISGGRFPTRRTKG